MKDFFRNNQQVFSALAAVVFLLLIFVFAGELPPLQLKSKNYLAKITAVEIDLLKAWQQAKGLQNTLAYNSFGHDVVLLQRMLSQDPGIYPERKITGYYGDLTKKAVIRFQKEYNLPQTGVVDMATKNKLNEIFLSHLCPEQTTIYPEFLLKKVTKQYPLPKDYIPPSLEDVSTKIKTIGTVCVRQDVAPHLIQMFQDAQKDGVYLAATSGYRKPEIQKYLYDFWFNVMGTAAYDAIAEPGKSEHQLGTTVDLTDSSIRYAGVDNRFARSDGGRWLKANAHKYGFIMSYPEGKEKITGYKYEPWHWRFVGIDVATQLYNQGLTFYEADFDTRQRPYPKSDNGLTLSSTAALSVFVDINGREHTLIEKNKKMRLPIANITKLMTALVASDIFKADEKITISENALRVKGVSGNYTVGDTFYFNDAMNALLLGSHNEIAVALAERVGIDEFVRRMNEKAEVLGLRDTHYFNVTGVDPEGGSEEINYSTAADTYKLLRYIFENRADIFSILQKSKYQLNDVYGFPKSVIQNTNKLIAKLLRYIFENRADIFSILQKSKYQLNDVDGFPKSVIQNINKLIANQNTVLWVLGGKTGNSNTPRAKLNLAIVSKAPLQGYIVSIVIGSDDNSYDMEKLLKFIRNSFVW